MKNILSLLLVTCSVSGMAQNFAPVGAIWHYDDWAFSWFTPYRNYRIISVEKDTIIDGKTCSKLNTGDFLMEENGKVSIYRNQTFMPLYDFNAIVGDKWTITDQTYECPGDTTAEITLDSTDYVIINGAPLKRLWVSFPKESYWGFSPNIRAPQQIIERIGPLGYMFPTNFCMADAPYFGDLRCYSDSIFGSYETGIVDSCNYVQIKTGIAGLDLASMPVTVYPNPSTGRITVNGLSNGAGIEVFDMQGNKVYAGQVREEGLMTLEIEQKGLFFILITNGFELQSSKILVR